MSFVRGARLLATKSARIVQARGYAAENEMKLTFAAANKVFYHEVHVNQIDVPTFSGAFGILPKHVPTLGIQIFIYKKKQFFLINKKKYFSCP